ncbi:hypothetical protein O181_044066 [Austropuccinia psidii MF-1]|uniref:Uncharacterized protein n=1 Tax=Austropuccinia psidii MF-1 TaxID=1389203 RepID=A0A9Q3DPP7_9BASI|nr:hypothetical protein [Austropuccinia psidii MF-1]
MVHRKILEKCGEESENSLRSRSIEPCYTEEYINALEANNCPKKEKINETVETDGHNDGENESDSEKDVEESETSQSDGINTITAQINNIDLLYEVLGSNSNLPQVSKSDTRLTNIQDAKLHRTKPEKVIGYTAGKSSISIVMVRNQEEKENLDTGACFRL